jgi:hypothetical protein
LGKGPAPLFSRTVLADLLSQAVLACHVCIGVKAPWVAAYPYPEPHRSVLQPC